MTDALPRLRTRAAWVALGEHAPELRTRHLRDLFAEDPDRGDRLRVEAAGLVLEEIQKINATLPEATRVRRFLLLQKELEADDNEITRTRKVRRGYVAEKYAAVIEAFYSGAKDVDVTVDVTYEDGRKTQLSSNILIHDVPALAAQKAA